MASKVSCLYILTVVCWASALWYLSATRPSSSYVGHTSFARVASERKNFSFTNIRTRSLNPHNFNYLINEPNKCEESSPFLVILVSTTHKEFDARQAIRETWGDENNFEGILVITLFLLGRNTDNVLNEMVEQESQIFHDIIVEDFLDSYHNLTLKTVMGVKWIANFCSKAKYVMKTDSDIFVNMENLIYKLLKPNTKPRRRYFTGYVIHGGPIRDIRSKWYMSRDLYPDNNYPPFCSGTGYVFSTDVAEAIYKTSLHTRMLHLEDVYVGLCLRKLGIHPFQNSGFNHWKVSYSLCRYRRLITVHQISPEEMQRIWNEMSSKKHLRC
ncbi:beta-1,3-galactosyltransferase 1 [Scyliorhinus canicula]|uniref:beta-1,3-galactosyltransferase 1 n=1 Tax=Scyliorhinus canicula TaxID=7830 RepID=UPI0018F2A1C0|nr:beta-1,3-galactosyltransferase 1 [Scyliorhinus canicula]XP_038645662.1 beta-1,3-galactosyltransferase 1 [Scyliorhinus canicula]XP_038645663.1 beta-1,3-galactosyltransferase 1 [Scyliorhinus canicula]XP_038645664.1 beta-1,3-galactosyltransferase 1 [Scyliorhinus canicula]XP_038645665.1 beta-1,3-galactosyltransferase 1 [Scyliorhinus canicula]XP_038645667.1 beta-1,3-galactosyltransferase 1 [Scyliorhinus canicula]XP_038645668.1 beta-1,3-galactosyltransferase 1 [Scyliorhinus canicula]XP_03864566